MKNRSFRLLSIATMLVLMLPASGVGSSQAQSASRTFPETGKTVKGNFLAY